MHPIANWARGRFHYAWIAIGVTFLVMLVTAGIRSTPSVMMVPLERSFGWTRAAISLTADVATTAGFALSVLRPKCRRR